VDIKNKEKEVMIRKSGNKLSSINEHQIWKTRLGDSDTVTQTWLNFKGKEGIMVKKGSILLMCMIALVAFAIWAPDASAMSNFNDAGAEGLSCAQCHPALADTGPGNANHIAHGEPTGQDCNSCHLGAFNNPPIDVNCTRCHGRTQDAGGDGLSAGEGRGLRIHHQDTGASNCGLCHSDAIGPLGVGENVPPAFYPGIGAVPLNPCDGSEESFPSNTVSLDNDGDLLTDGADSDCAVNTPPVANDDAFSVVHDTVLTVAAPGVLGNDTDDDGDTLTAVLQTGPTSGTLALNSDGSFTYTPNAGFVGPDSFTYVANDGVDDSNVATVTIDVTNQAPVAVDDAQSTPFETATTIDVLANDNDPDGDALSINSFDASSVAGGTVTCTATCQYTPPAGFTGNDTFTYDNTDGIAVSNRATVTVTVGAPANIPPVAVDDTFTTVHDTVLNVTAPGVLGNDNDPDGGPNPLTAVLVTDVANGVLTLNADGSFTYTPNALFAGTDTFTYQADDGLDLSNVATVTIDVTNAVPVANDDTAITDEDTPVNIDVLANDTDADGDALTINSFDATSANGGTVSCGATCDYTPAADFNGTDTFTYDATDGIDVSNRATVTITVNAVNDAPIAVDDTATTPFDTPVDIDVLANDIDVDGDVLTVNSFDAASVAGGTVSCDTAATTPTPQCNYTPPAGFSGVDTFTYDATDGVEVSNRATVTVTVGAAVNNPPVAVDDAYSTDEDTILNVAAPGVLANDSDPDGDLITAVLQTMTANGNLALLADGSFTYTPDPDFNGVDSFTYVANDGQLDSNVATVTITVNPVNDAPIANDDTATTTVDTPVDIDVLANDTDVDGDVLTVNSFDATSVSGGTVSCDTAATTPTPQCTYTPPAGFTGTDTFTYDATDGIDVSNRATVTITVQDVAAVEAEVEAPGAINAANRGRTPIELEFDDGMPPVMIEELTCGGDVSNAMAEPVRINVEDDDENEFVALFNTEDLRLRCEDTKIVCTGTLADGTTFEGEDEIRVIRAFDGERCLDRDDD
jgi:VCBS repeat-containing protein